jgi:hypothetical protein
MSNKPRKGVQSPLYKEIVTSIVCFKG